MSNFFEYKEIHLEPDGRESINLIMRPLKVRELETLFRVADMQAQERPQEDWLPILLGLLQKTVADDKLANLTEGQFADSVQGLLDEFFEFNFPAKAEVKASSKSEDPEKDTGIDAKLFVVFDFMISQGHIFSEIMEYNLPQFIKLQDAASFRVFGKQTDPLEALTKLGIAIKQGAGDG